MAIIVLTELNANVEKNWVLFPSVQFIDCTLRQKVSSFSWPVPINHGLPEVFLASERHFRHLLKQYLENNYNLARTALVS